MYFLINYSVNLSFLPPEIFAALQNVNLNYLNEIRLRCGQPVIIQYRGEYKYINGYGTTEDMSKALFCRNAEEVLNAAICGNVFVYSEQLKNGFVTLDGGIRVGIAGEYVMQGGEIVTIKRATSLNIRIPHDVYGAADGLFEAVFGETIKNTLIFSPPGFGKTTILRDLARNISKNSSKSVLVFDERNEIAAIGGEGRGFDLGKCCDVVRGGDKETAFKNAIRVMRPEVILTDELYGDGDCQAVKFAVDCGISVIASSHITDRQKLKNLPFDLFAELRGIGKEIVIYDKNFDTVCNCPSVGRIGLYDIC